ncbi:MAG: hypothetical protein ABW173_06365 [Sphingomonas sp.]
MAKRGFRRSKRLIGMTRPQIVALLGPPTPTDKFRQWQMVYVTGPLDMDFEWLLFHLDDRGRVTDHTITSD